MTATSKYKLYNKEFFRPPIHMAPQRTFGIAAVYGRRFTLKPVSRTNELPANLEQTAKKNHKNSVEDEVTGVSVTL